MTLPLISSGPPGYMAQPPVGSCFSTMYAAHLLAIGDCSRPSQAKQQDVFAFEDRVAFELATPVAVGMLPREQPVASRIDRHTNARSRRFSRWPRAARPLQNAAAESALVRSTPSPAILASAETSLPGVNFAVNSACLYAKEPRRGKGE